MKKFAGFIFSGMAGGLLAAVLIVKTIEPHKVFIERENQPMSLANFSSWVAAAEAPDFVTAASNTVNTVVHIKTKVKSQVTHPWGDFFGWQMPEQIRQGSGSGVIVRSDGYIVTNNHVIEGANEIIVSLNNNKSYSAKIIGTDPSTDLALIKIEDNNLPALPFGDSEAVQVGEWVLAVGNPFDLTSTVTAGIVSAKARNINLLRSNNPNRDVFPIESFIQTDAAVNPGNSGGALVNTRGELIGINTAIASRTGSFSGYSFAVPSSIVEKVVRDFIEYGDVQRAFIGVTISDVTEEQASIARMKDVRGAYVAGLTDTGAAKEAGILEGDIILSIGKTLVNSVASLQEQVSKYRPGQEVTVGVWRDGKEISMPVKLRGKEGKTELPNAVDHRFNAEIGASLETVSKSEASKLGIDGGVAVKELKNGKLKSAGVKQGFIITKIADEPVGNPIDVDRITRSRSGGVLVEGIYPDGTRGFYGMGL
jgi:serine protease Do